MINANVPQGGLFLAYRKEESGSIRRVHSRLPRERAGSACHATSPQVSIMAVISERKM
jgi:hypothetical protein